jgi:hypothetical protein
MWPGNFRCKINLAETAPDGFASIDTEKQIKFGDEK